LNWDSGELHQAWSRLDGSTVVDDERLSAGTTDDVERMIGASEEDGLGEHLRHPRVAGHHRGEGQVGVRRQAGLRINDVVPGLSVQLPPTAKRRRGRDRTARQAQNGDREGRPRMVHRNRPSSAVRTGAGDAHVPTQIDARTIGACRDELCTHNIGGQTLADSSGVKTGSRRQPHTVFPDRDVGRAGTEQASEFVSAGRRLDQLIEGPVVAGAKHRAQ